MDHKQRVLEYIKHDRSLAGARNLYNSLPGKSLSFQQSINRYRETDSNLKKVAYHLCKTVGIEERQLLALWQNPVNPKKEVVEKNEVVGLDEPSLAERLLQFDSENAEWSDIQALAADVSDELEKEPEGRKKTDLLPFIQEAREVYIQKEAQLVPLKVKQSIKLREQFPFLREKECPDVLKLLVSDLITAYENYKEGRKKLFDSMTREEEEILARDIVDNFIANKEAFAELEHYKESGEILGAHPIFEDIKIKEGLKKLSADELSNKAGALRKNISTNKKKAGETEDAEDKAKYEQKVEDYIWQEQYVKELLKNK